MDRYFGVEEVENLRLTVSRDGDLVSAEIGLYDIWGNREVFGRGHALRNPDDDFDFETGKALAYVRALNRMTAKMEKRLAKGDHFVQIRPLR